MKNIWRICRINIAETFPSNRGNKKRIKSSKASAVILLIVFAVLTFNFYNLGSEMTLEYSKAGSPQTVLYLGYFMMFMLTFSLSVFQVPAYLYGAKDYDSLMSMPITHGEIVAGKLMPLYIINFVYSFAFSAGFFVAYGTNTGVGAGFYVLTLLCMVFAQMVPMVAAALIAWLLELIANAFNAKNLVRVISTFLVIIVLMLTMFVITSGTSMLDVQSVNGIISRISSVLVTARFFEGTLNGRIIEFLWFLLVSTAVYALFVWIFSKNYGKIASKRNVAKRKGKYSEKAIKTSSRTMSLCKKDLSFVLSNTNYLLNSSMGLVIMLMAAVASLIWGGRLTSEMPISPMLIVFSVVSFTISITLINAPAISLEKPFMWLWKSAPVNMRSVINAKLFSAFIISALPTVVAVLLSAIGFKAAAADTAVTVLFALSFCLFIDVFDLSVGIKHPKLDWTNEVVVIKQSSAVTISAFAGLGICVLIISIGWAAALMLKAYAYAAIGISVILLGISALIYRGLLKKGVKRLENLEP